MAIATVLISIAALVLLITVVKLHPFLALLIVSLGVGFAFGMPATEIVATVQEGFGSTIGKIGIVIVLGVIIGSFLEHSGAAMVLATHLLRLLGTKRVVLAMGIIGYVVSIPVFSDSGFVLLSALNRNLTRKAGLSLAGTAIALCLGLACTHVMVPPTPGPLATAGIVGANLAMVIGFGMVVAAFALVAGLLFASSIATKTYISPGLPTVEEQDQHKPLPALWKAALPIAVPVALIVAKSMAGLFAAGDSWWLRATAFWGEPVPALLVGLACCLLLPVPDKRNAFATHGMAGKALTDSATIILITGAGGIFGKMLQQAHLADMLGQSLLQSNLGIFLPFVLAAILKSAQGSSTVAMITVASVMAPLMPALGYQSEIDKALLVCAIAAGSLVVSHVNDSYFWVVTQLSDMDVKTGYRLHTMGTLIIGVAAMVAVSILFFILH